MVKSITATNKRGTHLIVLIKNYFHIREVFHLAIFTRCIYFFRKVPRSTNFTYYFRLVVVSSFRVRSFHSRITNQPFDRRRHRGKAQEDNAPFVLCSSETWCQSDNKSVCAWTERSKMIEFSHFSGVYFVRHLLYFNFYDSTSILNACYFTNIQSKRSLFTEIRIFQYLYLKNKTLDLECPLIVKRRALIACLI